MTLRYKAIAAATALAIAALSSFDGFHLVRARSRSVGFSRPIRVSATRDQAAAEPSIRVARDGTIYIVAPTGLGPGRVMEHGSGGDLIWRSDDNGKTWTYLGSYDQVAGGGDADIAVDSKGVVWGSGLNEFNTTAAISTDSGATWRVNAIGSLDNLVDRQWIETYRGAPFAFMATGQTSEQRIIVSRLERTVGDYPVASNTTTVSGRDEYQWPGELSVDNRNGLVYVSYNTCGLKRDDIACTDPEDELHDRIVVVRMNLQLQDLQRFAVRRTPGDSFDSFTSMDIDSAGNVYIVWTERRTSGRLGLRGRTNVYLAVSRSHGRHWSRPRKLNRTPRTAIYPWLVAGSKGRVGVAYYGTRARGHDAGTVFEEGERLPAWRLWLAYSRRAHRLRGFRESRVLPRSIHRGNICTSGTDCVPGSRDLLDFFQIDLMPCGRIAVAYTDNSRDEINRRGVTTKDRPELVFFTKQTSGMRFRSKKDRPPRC